MKWKRKTSRIYNHPNGSISIPEKDNDDLGFALAAADIAVTRFKEKKGKERMKFSRQTTVFREPSNQNRIGYQTTKPELITNRLFILFDQIKKDWGKKCWTQFQSVH